MRDWDEPHLRTYKKRLDEAYPQGFPPSARYDGPRERYEKLKLEIEKKERANRR